MKETIYIYYTNDLHSHFEHWPQVATYMKDRQRTRNQEGSDYFLADIGDHMDRVHPITEATMGKANVELLNDLGYDFVTIGNNEGITLSPENLYRLYDDANFSVVCSNLECTITDNPAWLLSRKIVTSKKGVKIGVLGLTARFNPYYHKLGWNVTDYDETLKKELHILKAHTDIIILLSHTGINSDEIFAERFPEIDVIIGSHTHHLFEDGEVVNGVLLTAAGKLCAHVGEVKLTWSHHENKLINKQAKTTNVLDFPKNFPTKKRLLELQETADVILDKKIIYTKEPIKVYWFRETEIMRRLTAELRKFAQVDIAMLNAGLLLEGFDTGEITYKDVHQICPHPINPVIVELTGEQLINVIKGCMKKDFIELKLQGFGFRGEVIGKMIYSGIAMHSNVNERGEEVLQAVTFKNESINPTKLYTIATADAFIFGQLIPEIANAPLHELLLPEYIRDILVKALLKVNCSNKR